jgi:uncharacterized Zn finger protein (UPF0148 family)
MEYIQCPVCFSVIYQEEGFYVCPFCKYKIRRAKNAERNYLKKEVQLWGTTHSYLPPGQRAGNQMRKMRSNIHVL